MIYGSVNSSPASQRKNIVARDIPTIEIKGLWWLTMLSGIKIQKAILLISKYNSFSSCCSLSDFITSPLKSGCLLIALKFKHIFIKNQTVFSLMNNKFGVYR